MSRVICETHNKALNASAKGIGLRLIQSSLGSNIRFCTLLEHLDKYNHIDSRAVLKLDCEGSEYDIILSNAKTMLDKFSHI
jgi:FkbM family methyltransferase